MQFLSRRFVVVGTMLSMLVPIPAQTQEPFTKIYENFVGQWEGQLEYRDYTSDKRVAIPTKLEITLGKDKQNMVFTYIYNDGPNKVVKSVETVTIDILAGIYLVTSTKDEGINRVTSNFAYPFSKRSAFLKEGLGELILSGGGMENDQLVDIKKTIRLTPTTLMMLRESRLPGAGFLFRNQYTFKRVTN